MKSNNTTIRFTLVVLAALAAACASGERRAVASTGGSRPAWIEGESAQWPRARFITGVGNADDENTAADRARGEVARVFSADVSVNTSSDQSESSQTQGGKTATSFTSSVDQQVRTATQKALEGVDIVARWKDSSTGRYYALAALPKDHALLAVNEKAQELTEEGAKYKAALAQATDPFARAKAAAKLLTLAKALPGLEADSRVLGGGPLNADFDAASAKLEANKALSALDVVVAVSGEGSEAVETAVIAGLNASGLSAKHGAAGDKSDLSAVAQVSVQAVDAGDPRWKRTRSSAAVTLLDGRAGKAFASFNVTAREDATDPAESRRRCLATLAQKTSAQVASSISDFFANQ